MGNIDFSKEIRRNKVDASLIGVNLFHISFLKGDTYTWNPQTPAGMPDENEKIDKDSFPEPPIKRVSFSPSVVRCYRAVYPNIDHFFKENKFPHIDMSVYVAILKKGIGVIKPHALTQQRWVWDAHITKEHWVLDPVTIRRVARVRFFNQTDEKELAIRPFGDKRQPKNSFVGPAVVQYDFIDKENILGLEDNKHNGVVFPASANW